MANKDFHNSKFDIIFASDNTHHASHLNSAPGGFSIFN